MSFKYLCYRIGYARKCYHYHLIVGLVLLSIYHIQAQEPIHTEINETVRKIALEESQVMDIASWLCDVYGPRLTGSPMLDKATGWAVEKLESWDLKNIHLDDWGPFGRGWELEHFEMHMTSPQYSQLIAYPKAWSPSTDGLLEGEVIYLDANNEQELRKYKGKLGGKFILLDPPRELREHFDADAERLDSDDLLSLANKPLPPPRRNRRYRRSGADFSNAMWELFEKEKPLAVLGRSYKGDLGTIFVSGATAISGRAQDPDAVVLPQVTLSAEQYNRIFRLLDKDISVSLSFEMKSRYTNPDGMEHNIIAEIPGTDLKDEIVMFGAHFDSWHTGTGATDNGAGSAVMMEVARVIQETIKATGIQPRRTLRLALWTGEEQGIYGSRAYVREHFADTDEYGNARSVDASSESISAYYNLDNGTGKIRGIHLQGNADASGIFRSWLDEFEDLEANTITLGNTGGTDHLAFDAVGIPGFQFIQDPIAYGSRTHHSNMDTYDHLVEDDLKQASAIIASLVLHTALRDEMIPRKPMETE